MIKKIIYIFDKEKKNFLHYLLILSFPIFFLFWKIGDVPNDYYYETNGEEMHSLALLDAYKRDIPLEQAVREYAHNVWGIGWNGIDWGNPGLTFCINMDFSWPFVYDLFALKNIISRRNISTFIFQSLMAFLCILLLYLIARSLFNKDAGLYAVLFTSTTLGYIIYVRNGNISVIINYFSVLLAYLSVVLSIYKSKSKLMFYVSGIFCAMILLSGYYSAWTYLGIIFLFIALIYFSGIMFRFTNFKLFKDVSISLNIWDLLIFAGFFIGFFNLYIFIHGKVFNATYKEMLDHFLISFINFRNTIDKPSEPLNLLIRHKEYIGEFILNIFGARRSQGADFSFQMLLGKPIFYFFNKVFFFIGFIYAFRKIRHKGFGLILISIIIPFFAMFFYARAFTIRRFIPSIMMMNILAGVGLSNIKNVALFNKNRLLGAFVKYFIIVIFTISFARLYNDYFVAYPRLAPLEFKERNDNYRRTAQYLKDNFDLSKCGIIYENTIFVFTHRHSLLSILWEYRDNTKMMDGNKPFAVEELRKIINEDFKDKAKIIYIFEGDSNNLRLVYDMHKDIRPLYYPYNLHIFVADNIQKDEDNSY